MEQFAYNFIVKSKSAASFKHTRPILIYPYFLTVLFVSIAI